MVHLIFGGSPNGITKKINCKLKSSAILDLKKLFSQKETFAFSPKKPRTKAVSLRGRYILRGFLVFFLFFVWVSFGWSQIFNFPQGIQEVEAATTPNFEAGEVAISDSLVWTSITLANTYASVPVILVTPVTNVNCGGTCSGNSAGQGGMYPIPLVRNVTTSGFDISMCIDGGTVACSIGMSPETFHWFAFDVDDAGNYNWIEYHFIYKVIFSVETAK